MILTFDKNSFFVSECSYVKQTRRRRVIGVDDAIIVGGLSMVTSFLFDEFRGHKVDETTINELQGEMHNVQAEIKSEGLLLDKMNKNLE